MSRTVLITGSRHWVDKDYIFEVLDEFIQSGDNIIQGGAKGADSIALEWCNHPSHTNLSWHTYKPVNPSIPTYYLHRNAEMVGMADVVIAFKIGVSRGTQFTIDYAKARGKEVSIHNV